MMSRAAASNIATCAACNPTAANKGMYWIARSRCLVEDIWIFEKTLALVVSLGQTEVLDVINQTCLPPQCWMFRLEIFISNPK